MKLGIDNLSLYRKFGATLSADIIKASGFDALDYCMCSPPSNDNMLGDDYLERAYALRDHLQKINFPCNQAHAPYSVGYGSSFDKNDDGYVMVTRAIEIASILGAPNVIVHPINYTPVTVDMMDYNKKYFSSLVPYCEKFGINVSVENLLRRDNDRDCNFPVLGDPYQHMKLVDSIGSEHINICLDVGHSAATGYDPAEVIRAMDNKHLKALHIHDNDLKQDLHLLPYNGRIKWKNVLAALSEIDYQGDFNFETVRFHLSLEPEIMKDSYAFAQKVGRYMISQIK